MMFNPGRSRIDDFAKNHQRAPSGAPETITGYVSHCFVREGKTTLFPFRGAKSSEWSFCDPIKKTANTGQIKKRSEE
jgi:hypothetical protein